MQEIPLIPLLCPVRECNALLVETGTAATCPRGHHFDRARSGYLNLLQVQDRKAPEPGDSAAAVAARRRLLEGGLAAPLLEALTKELDAQGPAPGDALVDLGCGEGYFLTALTAGRSMDGIGVDISRAAVAAACKRKSACRFIVANADRRLPLPDGAIRFVVSITGRRNPAEVARLLAAGAGCAWLVLPGADDLIELREVVLGQALSKDRVGDAAAELHPWLAVEVLRTVRVVHSLDGAQLTDLLASTYRGARRSQTERLSGIDALQVTFAWDVLRLRRVED